MAKYECRFVSTTGTAQTETVEADNPSDAATRFASGIDVVFDDAKLHDCASALVVVRDLQSGDTYNVAMLWEVKITCRPLLVSKA